MRFTTKWGRSAGAWVVVVGLVAWGAGAACSGEADGETDQEPAALCAQVAARLRECSLLTEGEADCRSMQVPGYAPCVVACIRGRSCDELASGDECRGAPSETDRCVDSCQDEYLRFDCGDGDDTTIHHQCDGEVDCADSSDERDCREPLNRFDCGDGSSARLWERCDGFSDCANDADEVGCPVYARGQCPD